ncbi:MAG: putative motility protein [Vicinamibacterales bacterium]
MDVAALAQSLKRDEFETERAVLVLRKQRDTQQAQAQALIQLVEQASPDGKGRLINVRA